MAVRGQAKGDQPLWPLAALVVLATLAPSWAEAAAPVGQWWNAGYAYRQKLNLTSGTTAIPTQYSVRLQLDHTALVSVSQSLASGNDVRVAWWSGTAWVELDRLLDDQSAWNSATTRVWFRTQAAIGASSTDDNYYLYYGNPSAGAPPANWANVFLLYDDFGDGVLDGARWSCIDPRTVAPPPACTESAVAPGTLSLQDESALSANAGFAFGADTRWEARLRTAGVPGGARFYNYWGASDMVAGGSFPYQNDWITWYNDAQHRAETANNGTLGTTVVTPASPTSFHVYTFDREGAAGVRYFQDGTQLAFRNTLVPDASLRVLTWNDSADANGIVLDWVRVRKYVTPEPTFTNAAPENGPSPMLVLSGTYMGDGVAAGRSIPVGFRPDLVIISTDSTNANVGVSYPSGHTAVLRSSTMVGNVSKAAYVYNYHPLANRITSLDALGFTVGHPPDHNATNDDPGDPYHCVNHTGVRYYWTAFRAAAGQMVVGTYLGDGAANKDVTTVGFQPDYTIVMPDSGRDPVERYALMPVDWSRDFDGGSQCPVGCPRTPGIRTELANGFRVGPYMNANGVTHHYVAWKNTPGRIRIGSYPGNGLDNQNIAGLGFFPEFVTVSNGQTPVPNTSTIFKPASTGVSTDYSVMYVAYTSGAQGADDIQALQADGFQVGTGGDVNSSAETHHYAAFGPRTGQVNYRSIGPRPNYGTGSVSATNGSRVVDGTGTAWLADNRGRGDRIVFTGDASPNYTVEAVLSDTQLLLTYPYQGTTGGGKPYSLRRKFQGLWDWEACTRAAGACGAATWGETAPVSSSLVADDRSEVGIAYKDPGFPVANRVAADGSFIPACGSGCEVLWLQNSTTDANHTITITADRPNRHAGTAGTGVVFDNTTQPTVYPAITVDCEFCTVEWLELKGGGNPANDGIQVNTINGSNAITLRNLVIHDVPDIGIEILDSESVVGVYNNVVYNAPRGIVVTTSSLAVTASVRLFNNTVYNCTTYGIRSETTIQPGRLTLRNNIAWSSGGTDYSFAAAGIDPVSSHNLSRDGTSTAASPGGSALSVPLLANVAFVSTTGGAENLHLQSGSAAINVGVDLSAFYRIDVDGGARPAGVAWDIGADEFGATTAVKLQSFTATAGDASVALAWRTASELDNLGFHVYRAPSADGPWARLTSTLVPGLGSSALGQAYSFRDTGLANGTRYFYRLEDVDTRSLATSHGPVSAVPVAGVDSGATGDRAPGVAPRGRRGEAAPSCPAWVASAYAAATGSSLTARLACTRHGDPEAVGVELVSRDARSVTLEVRTGGFYALHTLSGAGEPTGGVRVFVPGFDFPPNAVGSALPVRRTLVDAVVGRGVHVAGVRGLELQRFPGLALSSPGKAEMQVSADGTVRAARRSALGAVRAGASADLARLLPSVFQGETKSAVVEVSPLRYDARSLTLTLARRVQVRLLFTGREPRESGRASRGRRRPGFERPRGDTERETLVRLYTTSRGLHAVAFEALFPGRPRGYAVAELGLERHGAPVAFDVEPSGDSFGPGARLLFYAEASVGSTAFTGEVAWELVRSASGERMPLVAAAPAGSAVTSSPIARSAFEANRFYQPGLLAAEDPWLWEALASGATRTLPFTLTGLDTAAPVAAVLDVDLQGASESGGPADHHVSASVNGVLVGEARFAGKTPHRMSLGVPPGLLREGPNELALTSVADTGVSSLVFVDRFTVVAPRAAALSGGVFEGAWVEPGAATLAGATGTSLLLDVTDADAGTGAARRLTAVEASASGVRFAAEAGRRYLVVGREALLAPRVAPATASTLRAAANQADYLLIAPRAFLDAAEPLVARRRDQGLAARAVAFEQVADEFGHGQPSAEAVRSFLAYAYHSWAQPSPRYVLLLGDASYDPRGFTGVAQPAPLPALWTKTSYLWTASDPLLAAVNGEDGLPDLAIGRLPAATFEQARALVGKLVAWEESGQMLAGPAALVADNPDLGGDFEANAREIAEGPLAGRSQVLLVRELGAETRGRVRAALDAGLAYLDYVGHGGAAVWASENVWSSWDAASLQAQSLQPLLVTMNCLNGYFVAPAYDSLAESLVKAEGRGAIAAFSPSGLSLDGPAHQYHRALMAELVSGRHEKLGDAVLAAQAAYAATGLMPELLSVYQLLGDPAMEIR